MEDKIYSDEEAQERMFPWRKTEDEKGLSNSQENEEKQTMPSFSFPKMMSFSINRKPTSSKNLANGSSNSQDPMEALSTSLDSIMQPSRSAKRHHKLVAEPETSEGENRLIRSEQSIRLDRLQACDREPLVHSKSLEDTTDRQTANIPPNTHLRATLSVPSMMSPPLVVEELSLSGESSEGTPLQTKQDALPLSLSDANLASFEAGLTHQNDTSMNTACVSRSNNPPGSTLAANSTVTDTATDAYNDKRSSDSMLSITHPDPSYGNNTSLTSSIHDANYDPHEGGLLSTPANSSDVGHSAKATVTASPPIPSSNSQLEQYKVHLASTDDENNNIQEEDDNDGGAKEIGSPLEDYTTKYPFSLEKEDAQLITRLTLSKFNLSRIVSADAQQPPGQQVGVLFGQDRALSVMERGGGGDCSLGTTPFPDISQESDGNHDNSSDNEVDDDADAVDPYLIRVVTYNDQLETVSVNKRTNTLENDTIRRHTLGKKVDKKGKRQTTTRSNQQSTNNKNNENGDNKMYREEQHRWWFTLGKGIALLAMCFAPILWKYVYWQHYGDEAFTNSGYSHNFRVHPACATHPSTTVAPSDAGTTGSNTRPTGNTPNLLRTNHILHHESPSHQQHHHYPQLQQSSLSLDYTEDSSKGIPKSYLHEQLVPASETTTVMDVEIFVTHKDNISSQKPTNAYTNKNINLTTSDTISTSHEDENHNNKQQADVYPPDFPLNSITTTSTTKGIRIHYQHSQPLLAKSKFIKAISTSIYVLLLPLTIPVCAMSRVVHYFIAFVHHMLPFTAKHTHKHHHSLFPQKYQQYYSLGDFDPYNDLIF